MQSEAHAVEKKIRQLARHLAQLQASDASASSRPDKTGTEFANYLMPSDITFPVDWTEFDNAYQAHCPKFRFAFNCLNQKKCLINVLNPV